MSLKYFNLGEFKKKKMIVFDVSWESKSIFHLYSWYKWERNCLEQVNIPFLPYLYELHLFWNVALPRNHSMLINDTKKRFGKCQAEKLVYERESSKYEVRILLELWDRIGNRTSNRWVLTSLSKRPYNFGWYWSREFFNNRVRFKIEPSMIVYLIFYWLIN